MLQMQNGIAVIFKSTDKPKVPLPSKLNPSTRYAALDYVRFHTYVTMPTRAC